MNIFQLSLLLAILLKCVVASERPLKTRNQLKSIKDNWQEYEKDNDFFDKMVTKSVDGKSIILIIKHVEDLKKPMLAALFLKRPELVDQVLKKVNYTDYDLRDLTNYRPELAESHECFFKVIDKIKDPENQEWAVMIGVIRLFDAKKHGSVISLINALEKREFNGRNWKNAAIQQAFESGALRGIKYIIEELHEHPAITSEEYAKGLIKSWSYDESKISFPFLLAQADQGDLEEVKKSYIYKNDPKFSKVIDGAFPRAESAGARHARPAERKARAKLAMETFTGIQGLEPLGKEDTLGGIISGYILG